MNKKINPHDLNRHELVFALQGLTSPIEYQQLTYKSTADLRAALVYAQSDEADKEGRPMPVKPEPELVKLPVREEHDHVHVGIDWGRKPVLVKRDFVLIQITKDGLKVVHDNRRRRGILG
jgi:hypothetical protein